MRKQAVLLGLLLAATGICLSASGGSESDETAAFRSLGYCLTCTELEVRSKIDFAGDRRPEHTLSLEGNIKVPEREDAVAVTKELEAVEAVDADGQSVLEAAPARRTGSRKREFAPVNEGKVDVEVKRLKLTANPYTIRSMRLEAQVVVAKQRDSRRLAAVVTEDMQELVPGLSVRIESIRLTAKRELTAVVRYERSSEDTSGPFLEELWMLGADGTQIAGGRWTKGDPFGEAGSLTAQMGLPGTAEPKYVRLVAVTKSETKTLQFDVRGIFQN